MMTYPCNSERCASYTGVWRSACSMATISTNELLETFEYEKETGLLRWKIHRSHMHPGDIAGTRLKSAWIVRIHKQCHSIHRVIWQMHFGPIPHGMVIDHIDGNISNNRVENLRVVTPTINSRNLKLSKRNKSEVPGVSWRKDRQCWVAEIHPDKKHIHLGHYKKLEDAITARKLIEKDYGFHPNHGRVVN